MKLLVSSTPPHPGDADAVHLRLRLLDDPASGLPLDALEETRKRRILLAEVTGD